jgi:enoyl-CoA hydratase
VFRDAYDADTHVVLLTANGDSFSVGGDFSWFEDCIENPELWRQAIRDGEQIIEGILNLEKPIVAKLPGDAIGGGATYSLFCDIIVAPEDAKIGDPHVKAGLTAGDGGAVIWPLLTSINKAKELLMRGSIISAAKAEDLGLVNHAVPADELDATVDEIIEDLANGPQLATRYTKMAVNDHIEFAVTNILRESLAMEGITQVHRDHEEAVQAFLSDRRPDFE